MSFVRSKRVCYIRSGSAIGLIFIIFNWLKFFCSQSIDKSINHILTQLLFQNVPYVFFVFLWHILIYFLNHIKNYLYFIFLLILSIIFIVKYIYLILTLSFFFQEKYLVRQVYQDGK